MKVAAEKYQSRCEANKEWRSKDCASNGYLSAQLTTLQKSESKVSLSY